jgi:hypothetical protein
MTENDNYLELSKSGLVDCSVKDCHITGYSNKISPFQKLIYVTYDSKKTDSPKEKRFLSLWFPNWV